MGWRTWFDVSLLSVTGGSNQETGQRCQLQIIKSHLVMRGLCLHAHYMGIHETILVTLKKIGNLFEWNGYRLENPYMFTKISLLYERSEHKIYKPANFKSSFNGQICLDYLIYYKDYYRKQGGYTVLNTVHRLTLQVEYVKDINLRDFLKLCSCCCNIHVSPCVEVRTKSLQRKWIANILIIILC